MLLGDDGHFYGTSTGPLPGGKIFRLSTAGEVTVIHDFTGGAGGASPRIGLTRGPDGNFYGTTLFGGTGGITTSNGIIYSVTPDGGFTVLHDITEGQSGPADGPMVLGPDDNLYGATGLGGPNALGMAYRITPDGDFTPFFNFGFDGVSVVGSPSGGLVLAGDGHIYGVAGTFFRMTTDGEITRLTDALVPGGVGAAIMQGSDGDFYGTSPGLPGSGIPAGAIFKVSGTAAPAGGGGGGGGAAAAGGGGGGSLGVATLGLLASLLAVRRRNSRQP